MTRHGADYRITIVATALICCGGIAVARAQDASAWDKELHAAARLIAGTAAASAGAGSLRAGIEIRLDPGWKTYWRYPGDSGVPPTMDFAGSENVKSVTMLWPAPKRFADEAGGYSIGYADNVVLPLRVTPNDAARPSLLHVKLGYAVCGNLCVPAQADLHLSLSRAAPAEAPDLLAAEARVPRRIPPGAGAGLCITSVHRQADGAHERVVVEVAAPDGGPVDLFAEGPTPQWALPLPKAENASAGIASQTRRFAFDLEGLPPGAHASGATLTFTAVSPADAIEVQVHLD
jgi:DsbC/DsbD-like thiol-disulfide interchange protein